MASGEIVLIGRDKLLKREIYPRLKRPKPFVLTGQRGIGKSRILQWAFHHFNGLKIYQSGRQSYAAFVRAVAVAQGQVIEKVKLEALEVRLRLGQPVAVFFDDLESASPKLLGLLTSLTESWPIYLAGNEPFREESKRILWGKQKLRIAAIATHDRAKLAECCIKETGSLVPASAIATGSRGIPARAWAIARGEPVRDADERVEGEEINFLPVMLLIVAGTMVMRFIGKGMGEQDIYIMGGIGMGAALFLRYFIFKGASK